jgi:hypothetical protein
VGVQAVLVRLVARVGFQTLTLLSGAPAPLLHAHHGWWEHVHVRMAARWTCSRRCLSARRLRGAPSGSEADAWRCTGRQVRFVLQGGVIWDVRERGPGEHWIRIHVYAGEAAVIPRDTWHRMFLLPHPRHVRMMRIYKDELGWQATYRHQLPAGKQEL